MEMRVNARRSRFPVPLILLAFLAVPGVRPLPLAAQPVPAGPAILLSTTPEVIAPDSQLETGVSAAALPGGSFVVGWQRSLVSPLPFANRQLDVVRFIDGAGQAGSVAFPAGSGSPESRVVLGPPQLAPGLAGPVLAWFLEDPAGIEVWAQRFGLEAAPQTSEFLVSDGAPGPRRLDGPLLASDPDGGFVIVWTEDPAGDGRTVLQMQGFSPTGTAVGPRTALPTGDPGQPLRAEAVGIDAQGRYFLIVAEGLGAGTVVWGQRFALDGAPLGPRRLFPSDSTGPASWIQVQRDGRFLFLWRDAVLGWHLGRFTADGELAAPVRPLSLPFTGSLQSFSADRFGNAAVVAQADDQLLLLLANREQVAQGPAIRLATARGPQVGPGAGAAALQSTGTLFAAWAAPTEVTHVGAIHGPVYGRLFEVRRDADFCVYLERRLLCDTAGQGGSFDLSSSFGRGVENGDLPLLGDFDGDLRDDLCVVRNHRTFCDTAHDGGTAEMQAPVFGLPGDVPLLGDLDGDGRAEPCRFRAGIFLCDMARNGGAAELTIAFGLPGDRPLLGDIDGDGDDDPCVARAGRFFCDTAHNGGAGERRMNISPFLGAAASTATPLLGDVDGDGRADPCAFAAGRLVCGLFGEFGSFPVTVIDRAYGSSGSLPLLGDVDAF